MFLLDYSRLHVKSRLIVKEIIKPREIGCLYQNLAKCLHANQSNPQKKQQITSVAFILMKAFAFTFCENLLIVFVRSIYKSYKFNLANTNNIHPYML